MQIPKRAQWPSVRMNRQGAAAESGPTGAPWVNANGWLVRMLRFRDPGRQVVLDTKPAAAASPAAYVLAVADAMAYGGAWVATYARESWPQVRAAMRFFMAHSEWRDWKPVSAVAVIGDFTGLDEANGGECMNLLARRQVGYSLAAPGDLHALAGVGAAMWVSGREIPMEKYLPWVRGGGTLMAIGLASRAEGSGRVVGLDASWKDVYGVVAAIHLALTRKTDVLRLWNAGSFNSFYQVAPDGKRGVAHLINYSTNRSSDDTSIWIARPWRSAMLSSFEKQTSLKTMPVNGGIEIPLPPLGAYAAIELEA
ncbi:MAG: hypothetical protein HYX27_05850 [Acidobacteria bacterium]|nr:hypothetical protein [Acidobacteriota bacterium]